VKAKARRVATSTSTRRPLVALGLAALLCCLALAAAGGAQASKSVYFFFGSGGSLGGQFNAGALGGPGGVAVNQSGAGGANPGDLYVADRGNHRIERFSANGSFISAWGFDVIQAGKPGDLGTSVFEVCTVAADCKASITSVTPVPGGELSSPYGIAIEQATGNLYVTNQSFRRVEVFTATGSFVRAFGKDVIQTGKPGDVGVNVFEVCTVAADCQIGSATTPTSGGEFAATIAGPQPAIAPPGAPNAGNVLVPDPGNRRIQEFTPSGSFVRLFGWDVIPTGKPGDLGANVFEVCTSTVTGNCQAGQTTAPGNGAGQFGNNTPTRLAIDSTGAIYAVEPTTPNFRVQRFTLPGNVVTPQGAFAAAQLSGTSSAGATQNNSTDVAVGAADHVFVVKVFPTATGTPPAASQERRVLELDSAGTLLDTHMAGAAINSVNGLGINTANGRLFVPSGTTVDPRVYVLADPPTVAPTVTTGEASEDSFYLWTLQGTVNPEEFKVSDCRFEYGTTSDYGTSVPCTPSAAALGEGTADVAVSASTEPLEPDTTYHYRLLASNSAQAGEGEDRTFTTGAAPADVCTNAERRAEQGIAALLLPDCRALEMVSPPEKNSQSAKAPMVSADGERVMFRSSAALAGTPGVLNPTAGDPYVASRGASGWETAATTQAGIFRGWYVSADALSFTPDLGSWLRIGSTPSQYYGGLSQAFRGGLGKTTSALSPIFGPVGGGEREDAARSQLQGASADHTHLYFIPRLTETALIPGDPEPTGAEFEKNTYVAKPDAKGEPSLELLARDRLGKAWGGECGARLGGLGKTVAPAGVRNQGAISPDGSRVYFSTRPDQPTVNSCDSTANKLRILERLETQQGPWIGELFSTECDRVEPEPCSTADGDDLYQGASVDQTKVYFTTTRQLADSDLDATLDLYLYDSELTAGQRLLQVSAGEDVVGKHEAGNEGKVRNGITSISGDGSRVYFVADGVLTDDESPDGDEALSGQPNLYLWEREDEATSFIGTLLATDVAVSGDEGLWGGEGTFRNRAYPVPALGQDPEGNEIGGDGHVLLFQSNAELDPDDVDGSRLDVYRYDAEGDSLQCVSCRPGGPDGEAVAVRTRTTTQPVGTDFAEQRRWVSEDGQTVVFKTAEGLLPGDRNGILDSYLWRDGQLTRLPGTSAASDGTARLNDTPVLSHDGSTLAFQSQAQLLSEDGDSAIDVYVARVNGGYPHPVEPSPCDPLTEGACQGPAASPPTALGGASEAALPGNPPQVAKRPRCPNGKRKARRKGQVRCVPRKSRQRHSQRRSHKQSRDANTDRRAGK